VACCFEAWLERGYTVARSIDWSGGFEVLEVFGGAYVLGIYM
jgi:hypothetical protein